MSRMMSFLVNAFVPLFLLVFVLLEQEFFVLSACSCMFVYHSQFVGSFGTYAPVYCLILVLF